MELLINKSDVEKYFKVAIGRNEAEFNNFIQESQMFDFKQLMPDKFFYDLLKKKGEQNYLDLLAGKEYVYEDFTYIFEGLKAVLSHLTYGLYLLKSNSSDSSFGFVQKKTPHADPIEYKERRDWYHKHRQQANMLWEDVKLFLDRNTDTYTVWEECNTVTKTSFKTKLIQ